MMTFYIPVYLHTIDYIRPYKRKAPVHGHLINIIDEVGAELPLLYQNASLLLEWRKDVKGQIHKRQSSTICLPRPPPTCPSNHFTHLSSRLHQEPNVKSHSICVYFSKGTLQYDLAQLYSSFNFVEVSPCSFGPS